MDSEALALGLAAVFAGLAVVTVVAGLAISPAMLLLGLPFGGVSYLLWYHGSGRLASRVQRGSQTGTRFGRRRQRRSQAASDGNRSQTTGSRRRSSGDSRNRAPRRSGLSSDEAYRTLGLRPGASEDAVHQAFREKAKQLHPDADGGDEEAFKRVNRAYEQLTD